MEVLTALASLYNVDITYFVDDPGGINPRTEEEKEMWELLEDDLRMDLLSETKGLSQKELKKVIKIIKVLLEE